MICGIAGGASAGKTTIVNALRERFIAEEKALAILPLDSYNRDHSDLSLADRAKINFDHPDAFEHDLYLKHLALLKQGEAVDIPVYDFSTHSRTTEVERIEPAELIIGEGHLLFVIPEVVREFELRIFISAPEELRLKRRLERDVSERGRTPESIRSQFASTVSPMHDKYIEPSSSLADLILDGSAPIEESLEKVLECIDGISK
ncbi:MAG: uridine kinase [Actinomycetota bacterium]|nr:uridine kinase [Acidimicrobiaceae bacterium]MEC9034943.1 uridine kinase [Actinomycetota bacterium]MEE2646273.1 uridine kinase [Actinomycetota bacterium]